MDMSSNATSPHPGMGKPQSQARVWFEPVLVVSIMVGSLIINRHRDFSIFPTRPVPGRSSSSDDLLANVDRDSSDDESGTDLREKMTRSSEQQKFCGIPLGRLDTSRFAGNLHSRILQKFPFLVEMFYWALNYVAYSLTKKTGAWMYERQGGHQVTELAQQHAIDILHVEHDSFLSFLFPLTEVGVQRFFLDNHQPIMTLFNQLYSLVHIPGTVAFLSWYYYSAPSHNAFTIVRRTMTLGNFAAFFVFAFYPCMPPRLLPAKYGFQDTVRQGNAESVWTGGANVNQLAAMPSLHFTYAFIIGCTFLTHSGLPSLLLRRSARRSAPSGSALKSFSYALAAFAYPALVLLIIVATANHFFLDAAVATLSVSLAFFCNRIWLVLQPLEALLLWGLRLRKPVPTTALARRVEGRRRDSRGGEVGGV